MKRKQKLTQTGSKTRKKKDVPVPVEKLVSSKIEHTKPSPKEGSLLAYRRSISDMTQDVRKYALGLCPDNLLSVKMALMNAVREVEDMIKERRREG